MRAVYDMLLAKTPGSHINLLITFWFRNMFFAEQVFYLSDHHCLI